MPLRSTQLPTHRKLAARPCRRSPGSDTSCRRHVSSRRHDHDALFGIAELAQVDRQRLARRHQPARSPVGEAIEHGLHARAQRPVVDAAWRLVQHAEQRQPRLARGQPAARRTRRRCCPARSRRLQSRVALARTRGASTMPSGNGALRHRHELESGVVRRRQLGDAAMKQVAARQLAWITQCYQGG